MLSRQYNKLCDIADFHDPELLRVIRSVLPERDPRARIERKVWEFAMAALFLEEVGRLHDGTEALSVGAGDERIVFWLANCLGRVVATDIYGQGSFSDIEADPSMLEDPREHAPFPYREDHLEVQWMDARALSFPDCSFDVVLTISSIEHFGSAASIERSASEIGRVLRPGGHAVVITECLVRHHPIDAVAGLAAAAVTLGRRRGSTGNVRRRFLSEMFSARELDARIVRPSGLRLLQPLDLTLSRESWRHLTKASPDDWDPEEGRHPMILMQVCRSVFTSVCLVMQKPGSRSG